MTRQFQQRRAQAQWSDGAFSAEEPCPQCGGVLVAVGSSVDAEILVCASCETRWRMELGRLYAVSPAVAKETEPVDTEWGMIATPTVIELDPADPTPARPT